MFKMSCMLKGAPNTCYIMWSVICGILSHTGNAQNTGPL